MQKVHIFFYYWFLLSINITWSSGCRTPIRSVTWFQNRECMRWFLGWCTQHTWAWRYREITTYTCCPGYGGSNCRPICNGSCHGRGTCIRPDTCSCRRGYTGNACQNLKVIETSPLILQYTSILAYFERSGQTRELYRSEIDSSEPYSTKVDTMWLNQKDYNYINVTFAAVFTSADNLNISRNEKQFKVGIISGGVNIIHHKMSRPGEEKTPFVRGNETHLCESQPSSLYPSVDLFQCNYTDEKFDMQLEHGDNLTLTAFTKIWGIFEKDLFIDEMSTKSTMFRFDLVKPHHCLLDGPCEAKALDVVEDVTKSPIELEWNKWVDKLSGILDYKVQVYLLQLNTTNLAEPNPWHPDEEISLSALETRYTYNPRRSGMYSFILNVIDRANNVQYARTLVLYDPTSNITLSKLPFMARSAEAETNFQWQNNLDKDIIMSWKGHFQNKFHEDNKLLNPVAQFKNFNYDTNIEKQVPNQLDDNSGKRTLKEIRNVHGIVKFEYFYRHGNQGERTPQFWYKVIDTFSETQAFNIERKDGDTINFWVKATDIMGNTKVDLTKISFDSSPPESLNPSDVIFTRNVKNATYPFSSRLQVDVFDRESGIQGIHVELRSSGRNYKLFKEINIPGNKTEADPGLKAGYTTSVGSYFYYRHTLDINNCWFVVSKEKMAEESVLLNLAVYNMAMKPAFYSSILTDLSSLDGMDEYPDPINLTITENFDNGVRLNWTMPSTCYEMSTVIVEFRSSNDRVHVRHVEPYTEWLDLTDLDPETSYNMSFVTEYGTQRSDPVFLQFRTSASKNGVVAYAQANELLQLSYLLIIVFSLHNCF